MCKSLSITRRCTCARVVRHGSVMHVECVMTSNFSTTSSRLSEVLLSGVFCMHIELLVNTHEHPVCLSVPCVSAILSLPHSLTPQLSTDWTIS
jgi:hypothetical protein